MKWPWVPRWAYERAEERARIAEDRLYAAHKEGAVIPPREPFEKREPEVIHLLPEKLMAEINNWESPEVRADLEREARKLHFEFSFPEDRILDIWRARRGEEVPTE